MRTELAACIIHIEHGKNSIQFSFSLQFVGEDCAKGSLPVRTSFCDGFWENELVLVLAVGLVCVLFSRVTRSGGK